MLSFFFINCIIKYCCLFYWRPTVMASALPVAFRTLFTCLFISVFGFVRKINSFSVSQCSDNVVVRQERHPACKSWASGTYAGGESLTGALHASSCLQISPVSPLTIPTVLISDTIQNGGIPVPA